MLRIVDVIEALTGARPDWAYQEIRGGVLDSRQAYPGSLFVALPGERHDGHDFVGHAFENGAALALIQRVLDVNFPTLDLRSGETDLQTETISPPFSLLVEDCLTSLQQIARFWRNKMNVKVIGITGSVGKSTTKELIAEVLSQRFQTLKNQGNLNNEIGLPLTLLSLNEHHSRAVLEMGFYVPGEINFLCELAKPEIGVITNVGTVHAERAGSQQEIARGKAELVQALPPDPKGVAVLNLDDPWVREMANQTRARVFFYGLDPKADLWADQVEGLGLDGIRFRLHLSNEVIHLRVPLIGRHSVHTVLRATAVGLIEGLTWDEIINGLRSGRAQLRLVSVRTSSGATILDDSYNASPESTLAALNLLDELKGHKIAVLGDMLELGQYERQGHEMVGVRAAQVADTLITVGEKARMISAAARIAGFNSESIIELQDVPEAIAYLKDRLSEGDILLVKGSHGMRMDRIVSELEMRS